MELCNVVDASGMPTGRVVARGTQIGPNEFYPVVHVWIRNDAGEYLIQQRALNLESDPGVWATTAGYVPAGEDWLSAAIRETKEELGIDLLPAHLQHFHEVKIGNRFADVWLAILPTADMVPTLGPEVADWRWVSKVELERLVTEDAFFAYSYLRDLPS